VFTYTWKTFKGEGNRGEREKTKEILTKINIDVFFGIMFMSNEITQSVYL
jgi:hypothetical protein